MVDLMTFTQLVSYEDEEIFDCNWLQSVRHLGAAEMEVLWLHIMNSPHGRESESCFSVCTWAGSSLHFLGRPIFRLVSFFTVIKQVL